MRRLDNGRRRYDTLKTWPARSCDKRQGIRINFMSRLTFFSSVSRALKRCSNSKLMVSRAAEMLLYHCCENNLMAQKSVRKVLSNSKDLYNVKSFSYVKFIK